MKNRISELRKEKGISQQKCADDLGISLRTLQRYEKGETENLSCFIKMATYFGVELEELIGRCERQM